MLRGGNDRRLRRSATRNCAPCCARNKACHTLIDTHRNPRRKIIIVVSKEILWHKKAKMDSRVAAAGGFLVTGVAEGKPVELFLNSDGLIKRGKCVCSHHFKFGIRAGPCRHLLALRTLAMREKESAVENSLAGWYQQLKSFTAT